MTNKSEPKALLEPGTFHFVTWNNEIRKAEILERRIREDTSNEYLYYVHYEGFDRRLDEWVTPERIVRSVVSSSPGTTLAKRVGADEEVETSYQSRFSKKRKLNDGGSVKEPKKEDALEKAHEKNTKIRNIDAVVFGLYEIDTWYYSPFPDEYKCLEKVYFCERCMKYMRMKETWGRHMSLCDRKCPPGGLVYESGRNKVYEIDGKMNKLYCQNLCLLAKFFIDHKTIYYDVEGFVFYILTEIDDENEDHVVGYFSKEKVSYDNNNLACILVFPPYQRRGYSQLLIEFSYELSKKEGKIGSPEKPISDLGMKGYRSYWSKTILRLLKDYKGANTGLESISGSSSLSTTPPERENNSSGINTDDNEDTQQKKEEIIKISINKISEMTGIRQDDVIETFRELGFLKYRNPIHHRQTTVTSASHLISNMTNGDHHESYHQVQNHNPQKNQQHNQQYKLHRDEEYTQKRNQNRFVCITRRMVDDYIRSHGVRLENRVFDSCGLKWLAVKFKG